MLGILSTRNRPQNPKVLFLWLSPVFLSSALLCSPKRPIVTRTSPPQSRSIEAKNTIFPCIGGTEHQGTFWPTSLIVDHPPLPISGVLSTSSRKKCCIQQPKRIWTGFPGFLPLSLLALNYTLLVQFTQLSIFKPCLCNKNATKNANGQDMVSFQIAEHA